MHSGLYDHVGNILAILAGFVDGGTLSRIVSEGPAAVSQFWQNNPVVDRTVSLAQAAAAILSAMFAFVIAVAILKKNALMTAAAPAAVPGEVPSEASPMYVPPAGGALRERWNEILHHLDSPREAEWKIAVVEADKLVDNALARSGFPGDSFGDRLAGIQPGTLLALDGLGWAHGIRNRVAHEMDYFLRYTEARQAISYYEQALSELQLI